MTDSELTKVSKEELAESHENDDYVYSADWKRLISCPSTPEEDDFYKGTYDFSGVKVICDNACDIDHCGWLSTDVDIDITIPEGVTHIGDYVFKGRRLDIIELPRSLSYIGKNPFALTSPWKILINNSRFIVREKCLIDIEEGKIIHNISEDGNLVIGADINTIGEYAFSRYELTKQSDSYLIDEEEKTFSVTIPSTVKAIGDNAFENCNITEIIFLGMPQFIGKDIFKGCELLEKIHVPSGMIDDFIRILPNNSDIIDGSGTVVNGIVFRNMLATSGITNFYKIAYDGIISVYGYVKDDEFHFSDENGNELKRDDIGIPKGVIVFDLVNDVYKMVEEKSSFKGKGIFIDGDNNISWLMPNENFYVRVSRNQIVIHKKEIIDDFVERSHVGRDYYHRARLFGDNSDCEITSIDERWYYYTNNGKIRIICDGKLHPDKFDSIDVHYYHLISRWKYFIIVSIEGKWGFFTIEEKYYEPKYCMVDCLRNSDFYMVQNPDGGLGIASVYGEEILKANNKLLDIDEVYYDNIKLIATTEDNIYLLQSGFSPLGKRCYSYNCASLDIKIADILKLEIGNVYKYDFNRELKNQFVYVTMKDGNDVIYDHYGWNITDSDEYYDWEEHSWEEREIIYDIMPKEDEMDDISAKNENYSDDELPF